MSLEITSIAVPWSVFIDTHVCSVRIFLSRSHHHRILVFATTHGVREVLFPFYSRGTQEDLLTFPGSHKESVAEPGIEPTLPKSLVLLITGPDFLPGDFFVRFTL